MREMQTEILKAIRLNKWLLITYQREKDTVQFWIQIKDIDPYSNKVLVDGLRLSDSEVGEISLFLDKIIFAEILEKTYADPQPALLEKIEREPHKYLKSLGNVNVNNILEYYKECFRLDVQPFITEYSLVDGIDDRIFLTTDTVPLSENQFRQFVSEFTKEKQRGGKTTYEKKKLALNVLSIKEPKGLFVLAYKRLYFDPKRQQLKIDKEISINKSFVIDGAVLTASRYIYESKLKLFDDFLENEKQITSLLTRSGFLVDNSPSVLCLGSKVSLDLKKEYEPLYQEALEVATHVPSSVLFGGAMSIKKDRRNYSLAIENKKFVNLDQLLAIHKALKSGVCYIEGPPGTGKTSTIVNLVLSAYFNNKSVLVASYNNHPIDGVFEKINSIKYRDRSLHFPVVRLGNSEMIWEAINDIKKRYFAAAQETIFENTLQRKGKERQDAANSLSKYLANYERKLVLEEIKQSIEEVIAANADQMQVIVSLQAGKLNEINTELKELGEFTDEQAVNLICDNENELMQFLHFDSAKRIKMLANKENNELFGIIMQEPQNESDKAKQMKAFSDHLKEETNLKKFLKIFPVVLTTNISASRLSTPKPYFDITIMDESSQCNSAVSLVPILRGKALVLVGDPQQLNPVIVLEESVNQLLKQKFKVPDSYDYISNSIYSTYLNNDPFSDSILLKTHYRCPKKIIEFNNKKYYNSQLTIVDKKVTTPLLFIDIEDNFSGGRNTSFSEAKEIVKVVRTLLGDSHIAIDEMLKKARFAENQAEFQKKLLLEMDKAASKQPSSIGIITPFAKQKSLLDSELKKAGLSKAVVCGTVHTFQGDDKDIIIFSPALTPDTSLGTYNWLRNNRELINVASSRAKESLVFVASSLEIERLHAVSQQQNSGIDDFYDLYKYVATNGNHKVIPRGEKTRALGFKPYSSQMEEVFLKNLQHMFSAFGNLGKSCWVETEVPPSRIFDKSRQEDLLFFTGRFDFVVFQKQGIVKRPLFAIELNGPEHYDCEITKTRDEKKKEIATHYGLVLYSVPNLYARRYKEIRENVLEAFFRGDS